jgi:hypothetical protein
VQFSVELPYAGEVPSKSALRGEAFVLKQSGAAISKSIEGMRKELERRATEQNVGVIGSRR